MSHMENNTPSEAEYAEKEEAAISQEVLVPPKPGIVSSKTYDITKRVVQLVLPAAGALYFALAQIWGLPYGEQVVGSIAALAAFGGVFLGISSRAYNNDDTRFDGVIKVDQQAGDVVGLQIDTPLENWLGEKSITVKVKSVD